MEEQEYLAKAQEAEALANRAETWLKRRHWEKAAKKYRQAAQLKALERRLMFHCGDSQKATEQEAGDIADVMTRAANERG